MSKKIVYFDKEVFEQKIKGWIERRPYVTSKDFLSLIEGLITEIDTDQSIEERAENKAKIIESEHYYHIVKEAIIQAATEQDLISKAREKEKADELKSFLYWVFHKADTIWVRHTLGWRENAIEEMHDAYLKSKK